MTDDPNKKKRHRSPSYPFLNLPETISLAQEFYKLEGRHKVSLEVAARDIGYSATGGYGSRILASLIHFGLFAEEGSGEDRKVGLSELGKAIVMDARDISPDREKAIQVAALNPSIHHTLWERWHLDDTNLPSDQAMRFELLRELEFSDVAVDGFIQEFKETLAFAQLGKANEKQELEYEDNTHPSLVEEAPLQSAQRRNLPSGGAPSDIQSRQLTFPLIGGDVLTLIVPHPLTKRDFQKLMLWIELMEDALLYRDINDQNDIGDNQ